MHAGRPLGAVVGHVVARLAGEFEVILGELREVVLAPERLKGLAERALGRVSARAVDSRWVDWRRRTV